MHPVEFNLKANQLFNENKFEEALYYYKEALNLDINNVTYMMNISSALSKIYKYEEAIIYLEQAIAIDPTNRNLINRWDEINDKIDTRKIKLGIIETANQMRLSAIDNMSKNNYETALALLNQALKYNNHDIRVLLAKAETLRLMDEIEQSIEVDDLILNQEPNNESVLRNKRKSERELLRKNKEITRREERQRRVQINNINNDDKLNFRNSKKKIIDNINSLKLVDHQKENIRRAVQMNINALKKLRVGDQKKAMSLFNEGIELDPKNITILMNKADFLYNIGSIKEAMELYDRILEIDPDMTRAKRERNRIIDILLEEGAPIITVGMLVKQLRKRSHYDFDDLANIFNYDRNLLIKWLYDKFDDINKNITIKMENNSIVNINFEEITKITKGDICGICRKNTYTSENPITYCMNCGHQFHFYELEDWVKIKSICPVCKDTLNWKEYRETKQKLSV